MVSNSRQDTIAKQAAAGFFAVVVGLALQTVLPKAALAEQGKAAEQQISTLEERLFQHEYPTDTTDSRIERLEKMIFGEVRSGSADTRLDDLLNALPKQPEPPAPSSPPSGQSTSSGGSSGENSEPAAAEPQQEDSEPPHAQREADRAFDEKPDLRPLPTPKHEAASAPAAVLEDEPDTAADKSSYPAVTSLEQALLGKTYAGEPIRKRLGRLETNTFGHPSGIDDLSVRVAKLKDYAQARADRSGDSPSYGGAEERSPSPRQQPPVSDSGWIEDGPGAGRQSSIAPPVRNLSDRKAPPAAPTARKNPEVKQAESGMSKEKLASEVSELEKSVFGKTYPGQELEDRLGNLEVTVIPDPGARSKGSLSERVNQLKAAIRERPDLNRAPAPATTYRPQPSYGSQPVYGSQPSNGSQPSYRSQPSYGSDFNGSSGFGGSAGFGDGYSTGSNYGSQQYYGGQSGGNTYQSQTFGSAGGNVYGGSGDVRNNGHPIMNGIGRALGGIGSLAAGAAATMNNNRMYSQYGYNPYGYGMGYGMPYGSYGTPYGSYGTPYGTPYGMPYGGYGSMPYGGSALYGYPGMMGGYQTSPFGGFNSFGFGF